MTAEFFHGMSPAAHERLAMLAEEASEIAMIAMKIMRHGPDSHNPDAPQDGSNADQLHRELVDLGSVVAGMGSAGDPYRLPTPVEAAEAWAKKLRYSHHQADDDGQPPRRAAQQFIRRVAQASHAVGFQAGVGGMETAGAIVSYLAAHPDMLHTFMTEGVMGLPDDWLHEGCLTWHAVNGQIVHPSEARARRDQGGANG